MSWLRVRFKANYDDSRPIKFPPPGPTWESGFAGDESYAIRIAYLKEKSQLLEYWPEATDPEWEERETIEFTSRFPKPEWWRG